MSNAIASGRRRPFGRSAGRLAAGLVAGLLMLVGSAAPAAEPSLGDDSQACQKCHDQPDLKMKTGDGKTLSLHVSTEAYLKSRHNSNDCTDCHSDTDDDKHAKERPVVASRRAYAQSINEGCKDCHKKFVAQFKDSVHAAMLRDGSDKAPLCSDCHAVHSLLSVKIATPVAQTPCLTCHEAIGKAYAADVHGQERIAKGKAAPICADCHQAHAIRAASSDTKLVDACLACHKDAKEQHRVWLPNAGRHFEAISCPVCHVPDAERRVNLRLFDQQGKRQMAESTGVPRFEARVKAADLQAEGLNERALWGLLQQFNADEAKSDVVLRGRLEVRSGVQAHQIAPKERAIHDCRLCHSEGAQAFQTVVLTIAGPDGRPLRHDVDKDVLNSLQATMSVRGFYAIGATRIKLLDWLLLLAVVGSLGGVAAHMTMKWATRRMRDKLAAERDAAPR